MEDTADEENEDASDREEVLMSGRPVGGVAAPTTGVPAGVWLLGVV